MTNNLWVDDEREPPEHWIWAKTNADAIEWLTKVRVQHLSLDYSLRGETTDDIMYWLKEHPERWPTGSIAGHSSSRDGVRLIEQMAKDFAPVRG
jgi:hypothetical protein